MDKELAQTEPRWREADAVNAQLAVAYGLLGLSSLTDEQKDQLRFYIDFLNSQLEAMNNPEAEKDLWYHQPVIP